MNRRILCFLLSVAMLAGMFAGISVRGQAFERVTSETCIQLLKDMEGFARYPYDDYNQKTVGYGTRCPDEDYERYMLYGITEEEADALLREYIAISEKYLNQFATRFSLPLSQQEYDALILFTYNCGTGWMNQSGTFRGAVIKRATGNEFINAICLWCNAGGEVLNGLVERRLKEANIYLNGVYSTEVPEEYGYVRYDGNGGKSSARVQGYDGSVTVGPVATATNGDLYFTGWFTAAEGGTRVSVLDDSTKGMTLYAQWSETAPEPTVPEETEPTEPETTEPEETEPLPTEPEATEPSEPIEPSEPTEPEEPEKPEKPKLPVVVEVTGDYVHVRNGPGTNYAIVASVRAGEEITITEVAEGSGYRWGKYTTGWICLQYTNFDDVVSENESTPEEPEPSEPVYGTVTADLLRVRSGPGTSYSIAGYLSHGTRVQIFEKTDVNGSVWGRVEKGWVNLYYIQLESDSGSSESAPSEVIDTGVVTAANSLLIRSGPGTKYAAVGSLSNGTKVSIYEKASADGVTWGRIDAGWISLRYVKLDSQSSESAPSTVIDTGVVTASNSLWIRSGPGTKHAIVGSLANGTKVSIYEKVSANGVVWGRMDKGWISLHYVKLDSQNPDTVIDTGTVVNANVLCIRSGAGTNNAVVGYLTGGTRVSIYEKKTVDGTVWGRIDKGWISLDYVKLDSSNVKTVTASTLRIRSGAGTSYSIVGYLTYGTQVTILEQKTVSGVTWGRIEQGWISMLYVK